MWNVFYNEVVLDNAKLREYCDAAAEVYMADGYIDTLEEPAPPDLHNWEAEFFSKITKELFAPGPPFCAGIILYAGRYISYLVDKAEEISERRIRLNQDTAAFKMRVNDLKRKASAIEKDEEDAAAKYDLASDGETNIEIKDAFNVITAYAGVDPDFATAVGLVDSNKTFRANSKSKKKNAQDFEKGENWKRQGIHKLS